MSEKIPEVEYLKNQGRSSFVGGGPTWVVGTICHLCGDDTGQGERDGEENHKKYICFDCKKEREVARRDLHKAESEGRPKMYHCSVCLASCTFEAMTQCEREYEGGPGGCPTLNLLENGVITDRRSTDDDPTFPSEFTYV